MDPWSFILTCIETIPYVGKAFRRCLERDMQVEIAGWFPDMEPILTASILYKDSEGRLWIIDNPNIYGQFKLVVVNHRTDRPERILDAWLLLEKKRFLFWRRVMARAVVKVHGVHGEDQPFENILLEPQSGRQEYVLVADGPITHPIDAFPRRSQLVLQLNLSGPLRRIRRTVVKSLMHDRQDYRKAQRQR